ncbi:MAG TPA: 50S ribosomal protein L19 [Abditibacteriaceae bacterium]|nr:50S ribosomal protein L19 [Abditibacteriaceae bacterium]
MNQNLMRAVEERHLKQDLPHFAPGDTLRVHVHIVEGGRERVQAFEGTCIARDGANINETFTVRRVSQGVGIERTFLLHSPRLARIELRRRGSVRRAKLYYLRGRIGSRSIRIKEKS